MKVLQIINSLETGGAEKLLLETIPHYNRLGIKMDILLLWDNDQPFVKALKALNCCNVYVLSSSSNPKDVYKPKLITKIGKYLKQYDIAHVHLFPAQYFCVLAKMITNAKTKLIFTEHNTTNRRIQNKLFKPIERWVYARYTKLVCITNEIFDIYKVYLASDEKLVLIKNGVDLNAIKNAPVYTKDKIDPSIQSSDFLLIQVSAFRPQKDQPTLIKSLKLLPKHFKLILVGIGERQEECKNLVQTLDLNDRVFFLNQRMDVPSLLKSSDAVVLSSHYEGLSLSSIEGMASGNPFIASAVPGLNDVVNNAGLLFKESDESALAACISSLANDKDYYTNIVKTCQERAAQYDISLMVDKHINLYKSLM